eukprot:COSAG01_NODE_8869_length_2629_cov_3.546998_5_plen_84_part_00
MAWLLLLLLLLLLASRLLLAGMNANHLGSNVQHVAMAAALCRRRKRPRAAHAATRCKLAIKKQAGSSCRGCCWRTCSSLLSRL